MSAVAALERLATRLGITADQLGQAENASLLSLELDVPTAKARTLTRELVDDFVTEFGAAGSLWVRDGNLVELAVSAGTYNPTQLDRLLTGTSAPPGGFNVALRIDKTALATQIVPEPNNALIRAFLYPCALERLLVAGPTSFGPVLWPEPNRRLVLLLLAADIQIVGDAISVVGGTQLDTAAGECARASNPGLDRIASRREPYIGWDSRIETALTPGHFRHNGASDDPITRRLDYIAAGLGAMYLCDRARLVSQDTGAFVQTEFRGREHVAFVPVHWPNQLAEVTHAEVTSVLEVVDWCYKPIPDNTAAERDHDVVGDRLPFVQTRIAQLVENHQNTGGLAGFVRVMPVVHEGLDSLWQSYIEGRVNEYLEHVRDLEGTVDTTVERLSDQTSSLTKRLTETALAAVAALIGSFIGAAYKTPFNTNVFRVGMLSYAAYVIVFPLAIGVLAANSDVNVALRSFKAKRSNLARVLGDQRVTTLVDERDSKAKHRFYIWTAVVIAVYLIAAGAAAFAAVEVPDLVRDTTITSSIPSNTTIPTSIAP